jgi:hypothetical protein
MRAWRKRMKEDKNDNYFRIKFKVRYLRIEGVV